MSREVVQGESMRKVIIEAEAGSESSLSIVEVLEEF